MGDEAPHEIVPIPKGRRLITDLGRIVKDRPAIRGLLESGVTEPREILDVTLDFDHNVVDGAPAARFAQRFAEVVEAGEPLA